MVFSIITRLHKNQKITQSLIIFSLVLAFAANLYGLFTGITIVLPHLFYIPIILAAFFYPRRGGMFAAVLSVAYLLMVATVRPGNTAEFLSAAARCIVFIIIAAVVSYLSERVLVRETEITRAKEEWERTFDAVPDLIALIDREHRVIRVNRAMADDLGISPEQAVGMKCYEIVHRSSAPPLNCPHAMLLKDGKEHTQEVHEENLGGDLLVTVSPLFDSGGTLIGSVHSARDITIRKQAEEALRESEERYRTIVNNMQDIFYRTDITGKITMLSPSAARLAGYDSNDQIIGKDATSVYIDPAVRDNLLAALREKGSVYAYPLDLKVRDGSIRHVTTSSHFYRDSQGTIMGVEGVIHNITEQRQAEEALKVALKKLNMLSSITRHDILNQIMGLRAFLELSREDLKGTKHEAFIEKEDNAAEAIQRQIEFTRFYQDIGVNAPKWQDAGAVIHEAANQLSLPPVDLQVNVKDVEIFADPLIVKVFFNLMENSLRHGERVTRMDFSSRESVTGLVITYQDNGTGITAEDKKKLFQKGFGKHTGLGLFLSREILAITGITITENGEPGKGVQFDMTVPHGAFRFSP
jgi:PAS domain S-box-containing protein